MEPQRIRQDQGLGSVPDGCTVAAEGQVCGPPLRAGGKIACFNPEGKLGCTVGAPRRLVTSVMFGSEQLDIIYATSLSMEVLDMKQGSHDGGVFA
jgi:sugar lactone lactonase YvrE